ncbi:cupin domain-containing protein [Prevotella aurantiaca]|jgi:cupin domain protein|uniref:cupin domain-containing protein n=1 Tax=Prevotella aurantiaca TaxID=596085 RepID=UPI00288BEC57|nr:cupin domain-containing protein [Prevotella aurantiaca]
MIIDFDKIVEEHIQGFKGGEGKLDTRNYVDDKARIMYSTLRPGARSGEHEHSGTFEVMYVISGELTVHYDGVVEIIREGQAHYCPEGHKHWFENKTDHDVVYFAIVPTLG